MPTQNSWLINHPLFVALREDSSPSETWPCYVEAFAPIVYSVPAFLGITLDRADGKARTLLNEIWAEELGINCTAHPVLFHEVVQIIVNKWGPRPELRAVGINAAIEMIRLCGSGPWPIGVAAMKAHESQFPAAYTSISKTADIHVGKQAEFFHLHAQADIEHSALAQQLLEHAINEGVVSLTTLEAAYQTSTNLLTGVFDFVWRAANGNA